MSGVNLINILATRRISVPAILITARSDAGLENSVAASGATCLVEKPFETAALLECLEKAFQSQ